MRNVNDEVRSMFDQQGNNAIQGMQNNSNPVTDSADNLEDRYTKEEIEQYKRDVERAGLEWQDAEMVIH